MGQTSDKIEMFQGVAEGDLLIHGMDTWHGAIAVSSLRGKCSNVVHVCSSVQSRRFVAYFMRALAFHGLYKAISNGVRENTSDFRSWAKARTIYVAFPSYAEQNRIAAYLDAKTSAIDALAERREQVIAHLQELKQSIIAHAVTKGLNPDTPTKDSGVSWLGRVPAHWLLRRVPVVLRSISSVGSDADELLSVYLDRGVIRYADSDGMQVHKPSKDLSKYQHVAPTNLVCNNQQAWRGSVGVSSHEGRISPAYNIFELSACLNASYANYLFRSKAWNPAFVYSSKGVGSIQRNLYLPWFKQHDVPVPPMEEQCRIVSYLDTKCAAIDELVARHRAMIERLKELKTSLIAAAVTGKMDVR